MQLDTKFLCEVFILITPFVYIYFLKGVLTSLVKAIGKSHFEKKEEIKTDLPKQTNETANELTLEQLNQEIEQLAIETAHINEILMQLEGKRPAENEL
jgi:hypothetical protein